MWKKEGETKYSKGRKTHKKFNHDSYHDTSFIREGGKERRREEGKKGTNLDL